MHLLLLFSSVTTVSLALMKRNTTSVTYNVTLQMKITDGSMDVGWRLIMTFRFHFYQQILVNPAQLTFNLY